MGPPGRWADADDDSDEEEANLVVVASTTTTSTSASKPASSSTSTTSTSGRMVIPPTHTSRVDSQGIQLVTSYAAGRIPNQLLKTVTKQKVVTIKKREPRGVAHRRQHWQPFGQAAVDVKAGVQTTVQSKDNVWMEDPNADTDLQDEDPAAAIAGNLNAFWAKQQRRQLERKYDVTGGDEADPTGAAAAGAAAAAAAAGGGEWTQVRAAGGSSGAAGSKYVPPSQRAGAVGAAAPGAAAAAGGAYRPPSARAGASPPGSTDDLNTIRVTNLSGNTTEADLQELFSHFGRVSRVYLAKNKETLESRGFAFVTFVNQSDAAVAMEKLQGFGYDHLILKLEWARPNTPKDPATSGNEYRSGYGKALAQDTKQKVSFASNLTK